MSVQLIGRRPCVRTAEGSPDRSRASDRGQAAIVFVLVVVAIAAALTSGLAELGIRARDRTQAQSAADASALAGLDGGHQAALRMASANDSTLVSWSVSRSTSPGTHEVVVVVRVGDQIATARASDEP